MTKPDEPWVELRRLTVSHQSPGECSWCDTRFRLIRKQAAQIFIRGTEKGWLDAHRHILGRDS